MCIVYYEQLHHLHDVHLLVLDQPERLHVVHHILVLDQLENHHHDHDCVM